MRTLRQGPVFINGMVNSIEVELTSLQNEFREDRRKSVVVPETFDVLRKLIMQHRHRVTYLELEATINIIVHGTSINSMLHDHFQANGGLFFLFFLFLKKLNMSKP